MYVFFTVFFSANLQMTTADAYSQLNLYLDFIYSKKKRGTHASGMKLNGQFHNLVTFQARHNRIIA